MEHSKRCIVMSKVKKIIKSYLVHRYPETVQREFLEWFEAPVDSQLKDEILRTEWDELEAPVSMLTLKRSYEAVISRIRVSERRMHRSHIIRSILRIAAVIVVAVSLAVIVKTFYANDRVEWRDVYVANGQSQEVVLEDGSVFRLAAGSRLIYPTEFNGDIRRVYLSGEAYADIAKDEMRRFVVSAEQIDVVVHGTRFNIRSYDTNSEVELMLLEGSIDMETKALKNNRVLRMHPGDFIKLDKRSGRITCDNIPQDMFDDDPRAHNLTFINSRLGDIAVQLERQFNVRIIIDQALLAEERYYSAFVNNESLDRILSTLERNGKMSYYWRDGEIHLRVK